MEYANYRQVSANDTLNKILPISKEIGITRLSNITGLDEIGIPVFMAIRPNSRSLSVSQGKGITPTNAKVSALMESIESYHAETVDLPKICSNLNQVDQSRDLYCKYEGLPSNKNIEIDKHKKIEWVLGKNILDNRMIYVPIDTVSVDMRPHEQKENPYFLKGSNGLASGNTIQEAINHAVCEIIERDSYSCWILKPKNVRQKTKIKIETIDCDISNSLIQRFYEANTNIGIWSLTTDSNLPSFLVRVISNESPPLCNIAPASGFSCHPDKNLALMRALTEAAQSRLTFIAGARDDIRLSHFRTFSTADEYRKWQESILDSEQVDYKHIPSHTVENQYDVWNCLQQSLFKMNISECIAVDLSKPSLQIPVVKVIIPDLEGSNPYSLMRFNKRAKAVIKKYYNEEIHA